MELSIGWRTSITVAGAVVLICVWIFHTRRVLQQKAEEKHYSKNSLEEKKVSGAEKLISGLFLTCCRNRRIDHPSIFCIPMRIAKAPMMQRSSMFFAVFECFINIANVFKVSLLSTALAQRQIGRGSTKTLHSSSMASQSV